MRLAKKIGVVLFCLLMIGCTEDSVESSTISTATKKPVPKEHPALTATKTHYQAIAAKDCETALKVRPGYSMERCQKIDTLQLRAIKLAAQSSDAAVINIDIGFQAKNSQPSAFSGLMLVKNINGAWLLQENITSHTQLNGATAEDFLAQYTGQPSSGTPQNTPDNAIRFLMGKFDPATLPDLTPIESRYASRDGMKMDKAAYADFKKMYAAAEQAGIRLVVKSATRNFSYQKGIWEGKWTGQRQVNGKYLSKTVTDPRQRALTILQYSAMPGSSRHHWGTDIDLNAFENRYFEQGEGKKIYDWLQANAAQYGFCQPYTAKGSGRSTGYNEEKWHWSYKKRSQAYTQKARELLKSHMFGDFKGAETAEAVGIIGNYILGVDKQCL